MSKKCYRCGRSFERFSGKLSFFYDGFDFSCPGSNDTCPKCIINLIKDFEKLERKIVSLKGGEIKVNWKIYYRYVYERLNSNSDFDVIKEVLLYLGILSYIPTGNWEVRDSGFSLNPTRGCSKTFFTRKEDVIDYACSFYCRKNRNWRIFRIGEVLSKSEALKKCFENK